MNMRAKFYGRPRRAFTLIEMLTVIAIIAILATLIVNMGGAATRQRDIARINAEKAKLVTMIDNYHSKLNYYPPDNANLAAIAAGGNFHSYDTNAAVNPLLYELTGGTNVNGQTIAVFNGAYITPNFYYGTFGRQGIANADPQEPRDFFIPGPLPGDYGNYSTNGGTNYLCGLTVPVALTNGMLNFWHYDSSSINRHNPSSYDLWAEFQIGNKNGKPQFMTNGNW